MCKEINNILNRLDNLERKLGIKKDKEILDKIEVSNLLNCHPSTVDRMRRNGELKSYKMGRKVLFKRAEIIQAIESSHK